MDVGASYNPLTVEDVFKEFKGRRAGLIKALTTDVEEFYRLCDPEKENLCLFGFPNEQWEVNLPEEEVPTQLPEPALGINFARDGMLEKDWLSLVAVHSDAWLLSVAFCSGARFGFDKADRKRLFNMINDLPTIFEVVNETAKKQVKEKPSVSNPSSNESMSNSKTATNNGFKSNDLGDGSGVSQRRGQICECGGRIASFCELAKGLRFLRCPNYLEPWTCKFFHWIDDHLPRRGNEFVQELNQVIVDQQIANEGLKTLDWKYKVLMLIARGFCVLMMLLLIGSWVWMKSGLK